MKTKKRKERERLPSLLAVEVGLKCRQFKPGTKETCGEAAAGHLPCFGDCCDSCSRGRKMIRYATKRADVRRAA